MASFGPGASEELQNRRYAPAVENGFRSQVDVIGLHVQLQPEQRDTWSIEMPLDLRRGFRQETHSLLHSAFGHRIDEPVNDAAQGFHRLLQPMKAEPSLRLHILSSLEEELLYRRLYCLLKSLGLVTRERTHHREPVDRKPCERGPLLGRSLDRRRPSEFLSKRLPPSTP